MGSGGGLTRVCSPLPFPRPDGSPAPPQPTYNAGITQPLPHKWDDSTLPNSTLPNSTIKLC